MKLVFIADKSDAFVTYSKEKTLQEWNVKPDQISVVASISQAGTSNLFGDTPTAVIPLDDTDSIRKTVDELKAILKEGILPFDQGVILTTTVARTGTKTLEKLISECGGQVIISKGEGKESPSEKLISQLNLNSSARAFLLSYIGDDYEAALPLIKAITDIPKDQQSKITEDQLVLRMPQPKGAVAPWAIIDPIMAGNMDKAIDVFRRTSMHSHFLVALITIKNNINQAFMAAAMLTENSTISSDEVAAHLGIKNGYGVTVAIRRAKKLGLPALRQAVRLTADAESKVKGGSGADPIVTLEAFIVELSMALGGLK